MLSKESAQLLLNVVTQHVRLSPDGTPHTSDVFEQFQRAVKELQEVVKDVSADS